MNSPEIAAKIRLAWWPSPQDYNEAVQTPGLSFTDPELQAGQAELTAFGLPRPYTGNFASVYEFACGTERHAVRCFLRNVAGQAERYRCISEALNKLQSPFFVSFSYTTDGITLRGDSFPLQKMEWVDGLPLIEFIKINLDQPERLMRLAEDIKELNLHLNEHGIAHGDLQHGNLLIRDGHLLLVDYDGMYVPTLKGQETSELGHRNYQHPRRSSIDFDQRLDNFSAWTIYISLVALAIDANLWARLDGGDDCLLFRVSDFRNPSRSRAFHIFENHVDPRIVKMGRFLRSLLLLAPLESPSLDSSMQAPADLQPLVQTPQSTSSSSIHAPMPLYTLLLFPIAFAACMVFIAVFGNGGLTSFHPSDSQDSNLSTIERRGDEFRRQADLIEHSNHDDAKQLYIYALAEYRRLPRDYIVKEGVGKSMFHCYSEAAHCIYKTSSSKANLELLDGWRKEAKQLGAPYETIQDMERVEIWLSK